MAEETGEGARAYVLLEAKTGRVLDAWNENEPLPMASTTKIMTALIALEQGDLQDTVTAGKNAFGVPGTSIYLAQGEQLTLEQMLYGLMLASGNDAAVAIAEHIGDTVEGFCERMNQRARETWLLECIPAVAEGTMSPEECWARVMALSPFSE